MKYLAKHKNSLAISSALSFFLTNLPIWDFVNKSQEIGLFVLIAGGIYALLWLEEN